MIKKYVLTGAVIVGMLTSQSAWAPARKLDSPVSLERIIVKKFHSKKLNNSEEFKKRQELFSRFAYQDELPQILKHARLYEVEPELLMAIRLAENGKDSIAYGILPQGKSLERYKEDRGYELDGEFYPYENIKEKQLSWAAGTIKSYRDSFKKNKKEYKDFISYAASKYAPIGAENDPTGLNKNWEKNVRKYYRMFKGL
jgi:hypothetical protein